MDVLLTDIRIAFRRLVRDPLFAAVAIITLAIGIGANSAIFTLVNGVLLRPLPFQDPDRLVYPHAILRGEASMSFSSPVFLALREHSTTLQDVAMFVNAAGAIGSDGDPEYVTGAAISASYFDVVGIAPLRGRVFTDQENEPDQDAVILLSEQFWRERYGADETILSRSILLNGRSREVVGIMPARASFPPDWRFWVPQEFGAAFREPRNVLSLSMNLIARLKPGVTVEQASADVARIVDQAKIDGDLDNPYYSGGAVPLQEYYVGDARTPLLVLLGAVGLVLLIVCANMANLLLAQAATRSTDFAVRLSLGAGSGRLMRLLLTESVLLGLIGGLAGLLFGLWAADALVAMLPPGLPRMPDMSLDGTVLAFTFGISLLAALAFGIAPALQARRASLAASLREGGRGLAGRAGNRTRAALVLAETALVFALVIGAGLLIRSFGELRSVDPGFRSENMLSFRIGLPAVRYDTDAARNEFWTRASERLAAIPGVTRVGAIQHLPLGGSRMSITFDVEGRDPAAPGEEQALDVRIATPGFFEAMGVPLVRGRLFDDKDRAQSPPVVLISEIAAAEHFPNEDPIGRRIIMGWNRDGVTMQGEIVGIVGDVRHGALRASAYPEIYFAAAQVPPSSMAFTLHTAGNPMNVATAVKDAMRELDATIAVAQLRPLTDVVAASVATDRFMTLLLTAFSAIALLLAAIGLFGVISYGVAQRRREIGVRMAVGASRRDVLELVVGSAMKLAGAGVLVGIVAALVLGRLMGSLLFGVAPFDPVTFLSGSAVLLGAAFLASMLPALSAARTPPAAVLNSE